MFTKIKWILGRYSAKLTMNKNEAFFGIGKFDRMGPDICFFVQSCGMINIRVRFTGPITSVRLCGRQAGSLERYPVQPQSQSNSDGDGVLMPVFE